MPTDRRPSIELDPIQLIDYADNFDIRIDDNVINGINTAYELSAEDDDAELGMDGMTDVQTTADNVENRIIFINKPQPIKFCNNRISTGKYSFWSFIPCFLFEQFRRWANIFFLFIALMQQIPDVSPTGRYTTLVPLLSILLCSAIKEIVEDLKRHKADIETNHRKVEVLREGRLVHIKWLDVIVGDIVKVDNNNFFPADLLLLSSSEPQGMSFIETANLDGETNLKIRQGVPYTHKFLEPKALEKFIGTLECEPPNRHLYEFNGTLKVPKMNIPVGPDQILLRGAMLRNTSWIYGLVIYTGHDTKLIKNSTSPPLKRSTVDKITNTQVLMLFAILLVMCIISCVCNEIWINKNADSHWYISLKKESFLTVLYNLLTFVILYNNLIPISLQVTLEMVRFLQAIFINMDIEMYHAETNTPAMARTSNLNEELGQIKYIFSDKTGTLTKNIMEFKKLAVGDSVYKIAASPEESQLIKDIQNTQHPNSELLKELMTLISVCHTVIPEKTPEDDINYHAASPDERALINGARNFGYVFETRTPEYITINVLGKRENYEVLSVIEFTSTRKRMSVIVRCPDNKIKLYCKGADTVIYERLAPDGRQYDDILLEHLKTFATEGLRTLCCAMAVIDERTYSEWKMLYDKAATDIKNRELLIEEEAEKIENNLILLGATAIEDKLQDGVPDTIETLLKADIKIWVLTGDKQETAINIGYSCKLIEPHMSILIINEDSLDKTRDRISSLRIRITSMDSPSSIDSVESDYALVIDGGSLKYAVTHDLQCDFIELGVKCKVVICCRVSPIQKAEVVELVTKHTKAITLAVGDGANDVAMIQKAHVGIGISGVEGLQAACASDYSIAQFRFLKRLLLVHGAWNYSRLCKLILYSFYKNVCLYVIEFWYAIYSGFSGQIIFERWTIGLYNVLFTALPPLAMGLFDKTCSAETMLKHPSLYKPSQDANAFNVKVFWVWIFNGLFHAALLYWITLYVSGEGIVWGNGFEGGYLVAGNFIYTYVVVVVCVKAGLVIHSWTIFTHIAIWGSILLWFFFILVYSNIWPHINVGNVMLGMHIMVLSSPVFWLGLLLIPFMAIITDLLVLVIKNSIWKSPTDEIRELEIKKVDVQSALSDRQNKHSLSETARLLKNVRSVFKRRSHHQDEIGVELSHGFAFSQEEGGPVSQRDIIRAYNTTIPKPSGM